MRLISTSSMRLVDDYIKERLVMFEIFRASLPDDVEWNQFISRAQEALESIKDLP